MWVLILPLVLVACGSNYSQKITDRSISFVLESKDHPYEQVAVKNIPNVYVWSGLQSVYMEVVTDTGWLEKNSFRDSLFLFQKLIDEEMPLKEFVDENIWKTFKYYNIDEEEDRKQTSFVCKNVVVPSELVEFSVDVDGWTDTEKNLYFAEYFYIHTSELHIISFVSDSDDERKLFVSSIDSLTCK